MTVHSQVLEVSVSFFKTTPWLLASLSTEGRMSSQIPCTQAPRTQCSGARSLTQAGQGLPRSPVRCVNMDKDCISFLLICKIPGVTIRFLPSEISKCPLIQRILNTCPAPHQPAPSWARCWWCSCHTLSSPPPPHLPLKERMACVPCPQGPCPDTGNSWMVTQELGIPQRQNTS